MIGRILANGRAGANPALRFDGDAEAASCASAQDRFFDLGADRLAYDGRESRSLSTL